MLHYFTELHSLHILHGTLEFGSCAKPMDIGRHFSKLVLKDMKLVVTLHAVEGLQRSSILIYGSGQHTVVSLQNCTAEVLADSKQLMHLSPFVVGSGAQVSCPRAQQARTGPVQPETNTFCLTFCTAVGHQQLQVTWFLASIARHG
jgi:hypothetical protein